MSGKPEKIYISDTGAGMIDSGNSIQVRTTKNSWLKNEYIRADLAKPSEWISAQLPPNDSNPVLARYRENQPFVARYVDLTWYDDRGLERDPSRWCEIPPDKECDE